MRQRARAGILRSHGHAHAVPVGAGGRLRTGADVARLTILVAAIAYLRGDDRAAALKAFLVLAPAVAARALWIRSSLDVAFAVGLAIEAWAPAIRAYDAAPQRDDAAHTVLPVLCAPTVHAALLRVRAIRPAVDGDRGKWARGRAALGTAVGVLVLGMVWELVEATSDSLLATDYSQGAADTRSDLVEDALAAAVSGVVTGLWHPRLLPEPHRCPRVAEAGG